MYRYGLSFSATQANNPQILHASDNGKRGLCGTEIYVWVKTGIGAFQVCGRCNRIFKGIHGGNIEDAKRIDEDMQR